MPMRSFSLSNQSLDAHVLHHAGPVPFVLLQAIGVDIAAERAELAVDPHLVVVAGSAAVELCAHILAEARRNHVQRLFVHGAPLHRVAGGPAQRVQRPVVAGRIALQPLFDHASDRALAAAHRAVQQQHALFDAVALGGALEGVDQHAQRAVESEDRVASAIDWIAEKEVAGPPFAELLVGFRPVRHDHVVYPLECVASHPRVVPHQIQVFFKRPLPVLFAELVEVLALSDQRNYVASCPHGSSLLDR